MKILIIANTIYPNNQPRAFRATELAKEFAKREHEVILSGNLGSYDYTEFEKSTKIKVQNLGPTIFLKYDSDGSTNINLLDKVLGKLLNYPLVFPNIELSHRTRKLIKNNHHIDLLLTLAPPHTIHWGAYWAKRTLKQFPKVWIADCGDPFMGNPMIKHPRYFSKIEDSVFSHTDFITVPVRNAINAYNSEHKSKINVIPQGFNFNEIPLPVYQQNKIPTFIYGGVFYENHRDPIPFLKYLHSLNQDFLFKIYTKKNKLINEFVNLDDRIQILDFIPREELLVEMRKSDFLVNFTNTSQHQSPSKLIDYGIASRPILNVESGKCDNTLVEEFLNFDFSQQFIIGDLSQYRIENVVDKFLALYYEKIN